MAAPADREKATNLQLPQDLLGQEVSSPYVVFRTTYQLITD